MFYRIPRGSDGLVTLTHDCKPFALISFGIQMIANTAKAMTASRVYFIVYSFLLTWVKTKTSYPVESGTTFRKIHFTWIDSTNQYQSTITSPIVKGLYA